MTAPRKTKVNAVWEENVLILSSPVTITARLVEHACRPARGLCWGCASTTCACLCWALFFWALPWGQRSISGFLNPFLALPDLLSKAPAFTTAMLPSCKQVSAILEPALLLVRSIGVSSVNPNRFMLPEPTCFISDHCCVHCMHEVQRHAKRWW